MVHCCRGPGVGVSASLHAPAAALGERFGTFAARAWRHWRSTSNTVLVILKTLARGARPFAGWRQDAWKYGQKGGYKS